MRPFLLKYHRPLFYATWLIVQLLQAWTTELFDDEAYYWVYSQYPAWGYFDHPPVIAILIRLGYFLFHNEFGVRFFIVLLNTGSIYIIESLIRNKSPWLFYTICGSLAIAQIGGMMAVPDTPLMFFVAAFFAAYSRYLRRDSVVNATLLSLTIALMLYTKYHAILLVLLTVVSNPPLVRRPSFYAVVLLSNLLLLPHMIWQHTNGYPSVQFHLFERSYGSYNPSFTIEFLIGQILIAGPLTGWLLLWASFRHKPTDLTERALKFSLIGIIGFFLLSTIRGRAEANWTIPAFVSLIVLSHHYLLQHERLRSLLIKFLPFTLALVAAGRILMGVGTSPIPGSLKDEFHSNRTWTQEVKQKADTLPVVFINSYQKASKYWFYAGHEALALNTPDYRRNNYNFWPIEDKFRFQSALVVMPYDSLKPSKKFTSYKIRKDVHVIQPVFYSFSKIRIENIRAKGSAQLRLQFKVHVPEVYQEAISSTHTDTAQVYLALYVKRKLKRYVPTGYRLRDLYSNGATQDLQVPVKLPPGRYFARLALSSSVPGHPSLNSAGFNFTFE
jgi:hypothetical protein